MAFRYTQGKDVGQANVTANKTLTDAENGVVQVVNATSVITLPAAAAGKTHTIVVGAVGATAGNVNVTVNPAGSDTMTGNGFTPAAAKGAVRTAGEYGDYIKLVSGAATWYVAESAGTWTRTAQFNYSVATTNDYIEYGSGCRGLQLPPI